MRKKTRNILEITYLMAPGLILVCLVTFLPAVYAVKLSLHETIFTQIGEFIGLRNYVKFFTDEWAVRTIFASLKYVSGTVLIGVPVGYYFAYLLCSRLKGRKGFRSVLLIPYILAQVVVALLWKWFLDGTYGPFVYLLQQLGLPKVLFFGDMAMNTMIFVNIWRVFPFSMVMILAALQTIPEQLYEAATIDGAKPFYTFWKITFPFTTSTLLITIIMVTLEAFNMVTLIFTLTGGGPYGLTETLSLKVYKDAFQNWHLSYATTTGVIIMMFNILFSLGYIFLLKREND